MQKKQDKKVIPIKGEEKALAIKPANVSRETSISVDRMIELAIKEKTGVEQLERLMDLKHKHEAHESRKEYHIMFCEMQSQIPAINKRKEIKNKKGVVLYRYAPLEDIVEQIKPFLKKYQMSYRWSEGLSERDGYKRIYCHIVGWGHEETSFVDIPIMKANDMVNSAQQAGSSSTYGKRYSLCDVLGLMVDDDDDGGGADNPPENNEPPKEPDKIKLGDKTYFHNTARRRLEDLYKELPIEKKNQGMDEFIATLDTYELSILGENIVKLEDMISRLKKPAAKKEQKK